VTAVNPYDEVPYPSNPLAATHPDRLAVQGILYGLTPAIPERCRVLELGCGTGGNLIAMALTLPESEFLGVDLAARHIAQGQDVARTLGLGNLRLEQFDLCAAGPALGRFDYIIAHGVYSWVPPATRDRLLALCGILLAEHGIAYISYAVYPGAYHRRLVREILMHDAGGRTGQARLDRGRALLAFLADALPGPERYRAIFKEERTIWDRFGAANYLHDNLNDDNQPVWFREFVTHAAGHGLQYLADLAVPGAPEHVHPPEVVGRLHEFAGADRLAREQYRDFLEGRLFRQSLLCRAEIAVPSAPQAAQVERLCVLSAARPVSPQPDLQPGVVEEFRIPSGQAMQTSHPLAKAAVGVLGQQWPRALAFSELLACAGAALGPDAPSAAAAQELAEFLLIADGMDFARLLATVPRWVPDVSARPVASPLARWQAAQGPALTNICHQTVRIEDALLRHLIQLLDGSRDHAALIETMAAYMEAQGMELRHQGAPVRDTQSLRTLLGAALEANLAKIARLCLLMG